MTVTALKFGPAGSVWFYVHEHRKGGKIAGFSWKPSYDGVHGSWGPLSVRKVSELSTERTPKVPQPVPPREDEIQARLDPGPVVVPGAKVTWAGYRGQQQTGTVDCFAKGDVHVQGDDGRRYCHKPYFLKLVGE